MTRPAKPYQRSYKLEVNDQCVPDESNLGLTNEGVRTVNPDRVREAYYEHPLQATHHLQGAQDDIDMAIWSWGDQGRVLHQEDKNHDEDIVASKKKR